MIPPPHRSPGRRRPAGVVVRPATGADLVLMASWQVQHLPGGFFPSLGERFVRRWHATYLGGDHGVALLAELEDTGAGRSEDVLPGAARVPVGFLVGSTDQVAHMGWLLAERRGDLARAAVPALLRRPRTAIRFVRTRARHYARRLLRRRPSLPPPAPGADLQTGPVAVVAAVVVVPSARGAGVGEALVDAFTDAAWASGTGVAELVTREDGGAVPFYERLGWERVRGRADRDGAVVLTYRLRLTTAAEPGDVPPSPRPVAARDDRRGGRRPCRRSPAA